MRIADNVDAFRRVRGEYMGSQPRPEHDTFDEFMEMERARLQEHASGKMAHALGHALPGESQEELDRIAARPAPGAERDGQAQDR